MELPSSPCKYVHVDFKKAACALVMPGILLQKPLTSVFLFRLQLANSALAGVTSAYAAQCLPDLVAEDTDLVLIQPGLGDWAALSGPHGAEHGTRAGLNNSVRCAASAWVSPATQAC